MRKKFRGRLILGTTLLIIACFMLPNAWFAATLIDSYETTIGTNNGFYEMLMPPRAVNYWNLILVGSQGLSLFVMAWAILLAKHHIWYYITILFVASTLLVDVGQFETNMTQAQFYGLKYLVILLAVYAGWHFTRA